MKDLYEISNAFYEIDERLQNILALLDILENCNEEKDLDAVVSIVIYYLKDVETKMQYWCEQCDRCRMYLQKGV